MHTRRKNVYAAEFFAALFCCFALSVFSSINPASAQPETPLDQLFTIRAIVVDETARSSSRARQIALLKAEEEAYGKLLRKITQLEDRAFLPALSVQERQALISGLEIVEEQTSSRRYVATMNVRFEPSRVSAFLANYSVPHVLGTGRPILVLHAHKRGLTTLLWQHDEIINQARNQVDWVNRIRGYQFARGEISERLALSASEVNELQTDPALSVGAANGLESAVLISSRVSHKTDGSRHLEFRYIATDSGVAGEDSVLFSGGQESAALVAMYDQILEVIDGAWRERLLVDTGSQGELEVLVPSTDLESFAEVESRLAKVTLVQSYTIGMIGLPISQIRLNYTGRADQLGLALRFEGLDLKPYGAGFIMELRQ